MSQSRPSYFLPLLEPNRAHRSSWSSPSTFTQKRPESRILGQERLQWPTQNRTNGGSRDTEEKDWHAKPTGPSSPAPVTTVTPLAKAPIAPILRGGGRADVGEGLNEAWLD